MNAEAWPELRYDDWADTCATLQLWTQMAGKVRLARTPWLNHSWHVALYVTARGLTTSPIPHGSRNFEISFDFIDHRLEIDVSDGTRRVLPLVPQSVAAFYRTLMAALEDAGVPVAISDRPCEIAAAIPFDRDTVHASYDAAHVGRFFQALTRIDQVMKRFRSGFVGKCSPVHFFWGSFDLAVTRFSGRRAPLHPGVAPGVAPQVMQEAYSHEVSSAGFWPGGGGHDAAFYSYAYPEPPGYRDARPRPAAASFDATLGEFVLDYDAVRSADDPASTLLAFLHSTYDAAADCARWDRANLECPEGAAGVCRALAAPPAAPA